MADKKKYVEPPPAYGSLTMNYIVKHLRRGYSPCLLIVGRPRGGKSETAIEIARKIAAYMKWEFDIKKSYYFGLEKFMEEYRQLTSRIVIIDEVSIDLDAHQWFSNFNLCFNWLQQTQAIKNIFYILVCPFAAYLARKHMPLIDLIGEKKNRRAITFWKISPNWAAYQGSKYLYRFMVETMINIERPPESVLRIWRPLERKNKKYLEEVILSRFEGMKKTHEAAKEPELPTKLARMGG